MHHKESAFPLSSAPTRHLYILEFKALLHITSGTDEIGEIQVLNDFRPPPGSLPTEVDAAVDGRLMAVLDLRLDESLAQEGLGREVVNRVQKLRKKAGLAFGDSVRMYLAMAPPLAAALSSQVPFPPSR